jgi:hypothetical protein
VPTESIRMNQVLVITPFFENREVLLKSLVTFLKARGEVKVLGSGRNGITVSVPTGFDVRHALPLEARDKCSIEEAEAPVLMQVRPKIRM